MPNVFDILIERGFVQQCTDTDGLAKRLAAAPITFYCGFDPTAESLHCGSLVPIMAMAHLQRAGHKPIAIIGGGTTMVGDPSGKTEMRKLLPIEVIQENGRGILSQLQRYLDLNGSNGLFLDNADWLLSLRYIDFLREVGRYFKVNEMIKAEAYRQRLEREEGLSFIEFNYQLLQAYDFLVLFQKHGCGLQLGGDDQWGNITAGTGLIRRVEGKEVFGLTFPLLTTARGEKMGKTAGGAVWLSAQRTSPYDFYQYWINTDDRDVQRFLAYFTFLPMDEVRRLGALKDAALREAKDTLAYEATKLCHGQAEADRARAAAHAAFGGAGADASAMPTLTLPASRLAAGVNIVDLLVEAGLETSKSNARRVVSAGGVSLNNQPISGIDFVVNTSHLDGGAIMLRCGKKRFHRVVSE